MKNCQKPLPLACVNRFPETFRRVGEFLGLGFQSGLMTFRAQPCCIGCQRLTLGGFFPVRFLAVPATEVP